MMRISRHSFRKAAVAVFALAMVSCAPEPGTAPTPTDTSIPPTELPSPTESAVSAEEVAMPLELTSSAFEAGQTIPTRHACHGENLSPPLAWSEPPAGTASFALVMDDPDAVPVAGFVWDHWVLFNIPSETLSLAEGIPGEATLTDGSRQGQNSSNRLGYGGPCPPGGQRHNYVFKLYAVDTSLDLEPGASKAEILQAMEGHILDQAELVGAYTSP